MTVSALQRCADLGLPRGRVHWDNIRISSNIDRMPDTDFPTLTCPRCDRVGVGFAGCEYCAGQGVAVNLVPVRSDLSGLDLSAFRGGPWGWPSTLAYADPRSAVTLGEGNTPLVADAFTDGLQLKLESQNPTGSHKDRAMSVGVTAALAADSRVVVAASSGNAGAALAAYAARAGLHAIITTTSSVPRAIRNQIIATGATLAVYSSAADRNRVTRQLVETHGCFPLTNYVDPGPGSNTFAIEGYKSIAYELARDAPQTQAVVVPTSRADLVAGIARGYAELVAAGLLDRMPRLVIAEPASGAAFAAAIGLPRPEQQRLTVERGYSAAFSIGSDVANFQGLEALWNSDGYAVAVDEDQLLGEYDRLRLAGMWVEASAATAVYAARSIAASERTVAVVSAGGGKDPDLLGRNSVVDAMDLSADDLMQVSRSSEPVSAPLQARVEHESAGRSR